MSECKQCVEKDKTIAELQDSTHYAIGRAVHRLQQQNTILREAMKQIVKLHDDAERMTSVTLPTTAEHRIAREALTKVKEDE